VVHARHRGPVPVCGWGNTANAGDGSGQHRCQAATWLAYRTWPDSQPGPGTGYGHRPGVPVRGSCPASAFAWSVGPPREDFHPGSGSGCADRPDAGPRCHSSAGAGSIGRSGFRHRRSHPRTSLRLCAPSGPSRFPVGAGWSSICSPGLRATRARSYGPLRALRAVQVPGLPPGRERAPPRISPG
jgi:hypothetical protein